MNENPSYPWARSDCRHFVGEKPCRFSRTGCEGCTFYNSMGIRILIIKLAAMGDVIRTTPLVEALHALYPRCHTTWLVDAASAPLLEGVAGIDKVVVLDMSTWVVLRAQRFDELYCLDKEPRAIAISKLVRAGMKKGFVMTDEGTLGTHDEDAAYALRLGIDDLLKFLENRKTYQEIAFEVCGLRFTGEAVRIGITDEERSEGRDFLSSLGGGPFIGINTGAGEVFATKRLPEERTAELAIRIARDFHATPVLLGGRDERERNARILALTGGVALTAGTDHPIRRFAAIVSNLAALVCADTLALHLAVAERVPVVALFGPTCPAEVHLYGRGEKVISAPWCSPCYKNICVHHSCMEEISIEEILQSLGRLLVRT